MHTEESYFDRIARAFDTQWKSREEPATVLLEYGFWLLAIAAIVYNCTPIWVYTAQPVAIVAAAVGIVGLLFMIAGIVVLYYNGLMCFKSGEKYATAKKGSEFFKIPFYHWKSLTLLLMCAGLLWIIEIVM